MNPNNPADKAIAERINVKLAGTGSSVSYECGLWRVGYLDGSKPRLIDDLAALEAELEAELEALAPEESVKQ